MRSTLIFIYISLLSPVRSNITHNDVVDIISETVRHVLVSTALRFTVSLTQGDTVGPKVATHHVNEPKRVVFNLLATAILSTIEETGVGVEGTILLLEHCTERHHKLVPLLPDQLGSSYRGDLRPRAGNVHGLWIEIGNAQPRLERVIF